MEPLVAGAIAFFTAVATKVASKSEDKLAAFVVNRAPQLLGLFQRKKPELAAKLEAAEPEQQQVLVAEIVEAANSDPEIKAELQALGTAAQVNPQVFQQIKNVGAQVFGGNNTFNQNFY